MKGTLRWKWTDDDGRTHKFLIPDSFYVPHGGARLLCPQHWAQTQKDRKPTFGTGEWTNAKKCVLYWDQKRYKKTIYLDMGRLNVATMRLMPGYHAFKAFCAEAEVDDIFGYDFNPLIAEAAEISDDDESVIDPHDNLDSQEGWSSEKLQSTDHDVWHAEKLRMFNLVGKTSSPPNPIVIVDEEDKSGNQTPTTGVIALTLPVRAHQLHKAAAHGEVWDTPKMLGEMQRPIVFSMHVCQGHQKALVSKNQKHRISRFEPRRPRRRHFSGPNGITSPWLGSPNDGIFNQAALPIHNGFH